MKRLLSIIVITYSTPLMAGPWFSRPEPQGIRIEAHLYKVNGKKLTEISKDQDDYYRNGQDEYTRDSVPAQPEDLKSANRITIHSALFDSKKKLATITYYVRIGREATPKKGCAEVKFGESIPLTWSVDMEVELASTYISRNIEMSDK